MTTSTAGAVRPGAGIRASRGQPGRRLSVLHLHSGNLYGGIETMLCGLARHRSRCAAVEPAFALAFDGRLGEELRSSGASVDILGHVRLARPDQVWRVRRRLRTLLGRNSFDAAICHSPWSLAVFGAVLRQTRIPLLLWLHGMTRGRHWIERWARRTRPAAVICNSHYTERGASALFPAAPSEVIYPPFEPLRSASDREVVCEELRTPSGATVIVQVGRMEALKGHRVLLEGLSRLRERYDWWCWIVGGAQRPSEHEYENALKRMAESLGIAGRVTFTGERVDVHRLLAAADIYCQPNTEPEGFGLVFVEALAAGLPVVGSARGGTLEIIDESCGELVPPGQADALAAALRGLLDDPARRRGLGGAGPTRARELCDPATQLGRLAHVITGLLSAAPGRSL